MDNFPSGAKPLNSKNYMPLFKQVKSGLIESINEGLWQIGDKIPSERELAQKYSVSRITINKALAELIAEKWLYAERGRGTFVADRERKRSERKVMSICLLSPHKYLEFDFYSGFFSDTVNSIRKMVEGKYEFVMYSSEWSPEKEKTVLANMIADHIAGLVVFPLVNEENEAINYSSYLEITNAGIPIVFVYRQPKSLRISSVSYDTRAIFELILDHMSNLNHIGYLAYSAHTYINRQRLRYFKEVMEGFGKPVEDKLVRFYNNHIHREEIIDEINDIASHYLQETELEGLICHDELIAFLVQNYFKKHGRRNIIIIGINNYKKYLENYLHLFGIADIKHLLSVDIQSDLIGEKAIEILIDSIEHPKQSSIQKVLLMPQLV